MVPLLGLANIAINEIKTLAGKGLIAPRTDLKYLL